MSLSRFAAGLLVGLLHSVASAVVYTPTITTDPPVSGAGISVNTATGVITGGTGNGQISLRSATIGANANPGSTIMLGSNTYTLSIPGDANDRGFVSFNPAIGDLNINATGTTLQGAGPANTTITQTTGGDRVLTDNPTSAIGFTFTMSGVTITGGRDTTNFQGGGGLFVGGKDNTTTITNCVFRNNKLIGPAGLGGGALINTGGNLIIDNCTFGGPNAGDENDSGVVSGGALSYDSSDFVNPMGSGTLTITNSTFVNNKAGSVAGGGGAITISNSNLSAATANISTSVFSGNQATGASGGAIIAQSGTLTVTRSTFLNNHAAVGGGAIYGAGTPNSVQFSRFVGNTAGNPALGNTLNAQAATLNANDNWWGLNTGPAANDVTANVTHANFLQLKLTAAPPSIALSGSSALTASFLSDSAGNPISVANLVKVIGLPITFAGGLYGTTSGASATVQASGTATATFNAGTTAGVSAATAQVDNGVATANVTIVPVVTANTANLPITATTMPIAGAGFSTTPGNNTMTFNNGATGTVTAATPTQLTVTFGTKPAAPGSLTAVVTTNGASSGAPVQVATVIPVITPSTASLAANATSMVINGFGFNATPASNSVTFSGAGTGSGTVTVASTTSLTTTVPATLTAGALNATMSNGPFSSGGPVQVATVRPVVSASFPNILATATSVTISGFGFSTTPGNNTVAFNNGATGIVTAATATTLTVTSVAGLTGGLLTAVVTTNGVGSGAAVQVATVSPVVTPNMSELALGATTLNIGGAGFSTTPGNNAVTFFPGGTGTVTASSYTQLTVTSLTGVALGPLSASVVVNGGSSGAAVQVATVVGPPVISGPTSTNVKRSSAELGGFVVSDGGTAIAERGVVYAPTAVNADPKISGVGVVKVTVAGTTGLFSTNVTGLLANTGYSFKAYAINNVDATYTSVGSFTTTNPILDIDDNLGYEGLHDGVILIRYMLSMTGSALTDGALGTGAQRIDPGDVENYLNQIKSLLDIDDNTEVDALTDGLMIVRYMLGVRGDALISGAIGPNANRVVAKEIEDYIKMLMPD